VIPHCIVYRHFFKEVVYSTRKRAPFFSCHAIPYMSGIGEYTPHVIAIIGLSHTRGDRGELKNRQRFQS